ncbi:MAG: cysteine desulfurase [Candidatus Omnitrophica bacterium]|nr:cysteine desulfurase [Candidatus Omnitrophota bacterium]
MIYLDYNATAPLRPRVLEAMRPPGGGAFGNASSLHAKGREARGALEAARQELLGFLGDPQGQLVFTSGGTEADNLALKGAARARGAGGGRLIVSAVEHHAVLHPAQALAREGFEVTALPVDRQGLVDPEALRAGLTPDTFLISVMHANNETGAVQPIEEVGRIARERGILFHTDAVQSFGKISLDMNRVNADLVSISAHKLGGPQGAGALYVRKGVRLAPLLHGGPHEGTLRAGTENVAGIVGMGAAASASVDDLREGRVARMEALRDRLQEELMKRVPEALVHAKGVQRLANTLNVSFLGASGETLLAALDLAGICVSTGAACSSGSAEPSHVLKAMGLNDREIEGSIRFSLGWATTPEEIEAALAAIPAVVARVRQASHPVKT